MIPPLPPPLFTKTKMAHRTSAPAAHTAKLVMERYDLEVRPPETLASGRIDKLQASLAHVATVIDLATNIFHVAMLRPELRYWQERLGTDTATAPQIATFFQKVLDAISLIPRHVQSERTLTTTLESPAEFRSNQPLVHQLSRVGTEGARTLLHYYVVTPKTGLPDPTLDTVRLAKMIDIGIGWTRAAQVEPILTHARNELKEGRSSQKDIVRYLRNVGILLEYLPGYEERAEELKLL